MGTSFTLLVLVDALHEAGVIDDPGLDKARKYLASIPPDLKTTSEDYEKWRNEQ